MDIITRAEWGARSPQSRSTTNWSARREFVVHYSEGPTNQSVRSIQNFHMDGRGWSDIGYNFLVDNKGRIYEGRGWLVIGAHAQGHNTSGIGVCFIGRDGDATDAAKKAIRWLYDEARKRAGHPLSMNGHGQLSGNSTNCPGKQLLTWVRAGMPTTKEDEDMPLTDEDCKKVARYVWEQDTMPVPPGVDPGDNPTWQPRNVLRETYGRALETKNLVIALASQSPDVDEEAIVAGVLAGLTPEKIAAAIPAELADQVVEALAARLES